MAKFKVGDIIVGNKRNDYNITARGMKCVVTFIFHNGNIRVRRLDGNLEFTVKPEFFDLVENGEITITRHGDKVVANYGKKVGVAKCSPEDTFDFVTGAKLAFERLMEVMEDTPKPKRDFVAGEFVRVTANDGTHFFDVGSIVKVVRSAYGNSIKCYGLTSTPSGYQFECQYLEPSEIEHLSDDTCNERSI